MTIILFFSFAGIGGVNTAEGMAESAAGHGWGDAGGGGGHSCHYSHKRVSTVFTLNHAYTQWFFHFFAI